MIKIRGFKTETKSCASSANGNIQDEVGKVQLVDCVCAARVKLMSGNFTDASVSDEKLRDIKLVLITALCSKSGVANPVSFVVTEGEGRPCYATATLPNPPRLDHATAIRRLYNRPRERERERERESCGNK